MFTLNNDIQALILDNDSYFGWSIDDQLHDAQKARQAKAVMKAKGVDHLFGDDNIYDIVRTAPDFKPSREAYVKVCASLGVDPAKTVMIDDGAKHLDEARKLGARTVLFDQFDKFGKIEQHAPHDRVTSINDFIEDLVDSVRQQRGLAPLRPSAATEALSSHHRR